MTSSAHNDKTAAGARQQQEGKGEVQRDPLADEDAVAYFTRLGGTHRRIPLTARELQAYAFHLALGLTQSARRLVFWRPDAETGWMRMQDRRSQEHVKIHDYMWAGTLLSTIDAHATTVDSIITPEKPFVVVFVCGENSIVGLVETTRQLSNTNMTQVGTVNSVVLGATPREAFSSAGDKWAVDVRVTFGLEWYRGIEKTLVSYAASKNTAIDKMCAP